MSFVADQSGKKVTTLVPYKKLEELYGYYAYAKSISGNRKFDLEGVTSCSNNGMVFYLVNEKTGDILKADSKNLTKLNINYDSYPDFSYDLRNDGFMGVTADCATNKLYVAKLKNPNIVFEVDLNLGKVVRQFNMSTGSDSEDDISDLFFKNGQLYVLQKNITSIALVDPTVKSNNFVSKRLDYSSMSDLTKIDEIGIAEALVVQNNSIFLFLDQRKSNKANNDQSKDVIVELKI
ncbi:MAG: SdiA-regulated domain-containing protein [Bdellovibrionota bacterium]